MGLAVKLEMFEELVQGHLEDFLLQDYVLATEKAEAATELLESRLPKKKMLELVLE
jgi:hypothetical protein